MPQSARAQANRAGADRRRRSLTKLTGAMALDVEGALDGFSFQDVSDNDDSGDELVHSGSSRGGGSGGDIGGSVEAGRRISDKASKLLGMTEGDMLGEDGPPKRHCSYPGSTAAKNVGGSSPPPRRVSYSRSHAKAAKILGTDSKYGVGGVGLPTTSEMSEASVGYDSDDVGGGANATRRNNRYTSGAFESFGSDSAHAGADDESEVTYEGSLDHLPSKKNKKFRKARKGASRLMKSLRRPTPGDDDNSAVNDASANHPASTVHVPQDSSHQKMNSSDHSLGGGSGGGNAIRGRMTRGISSKFPAIGGGGGGGSLTRPPKKDLAMSVPPSVGVSFNLDEDHHDDDGGGGGCQGGRPTRRSMTCRRDNIDAKSLTMGLDLESANFLDWMTQAKCQEWLKSLSRRDPRFSIKSFFDDVARDGADSIEQEGGFQPELLSPLLSMFQRSSVFSVWRPTSVDSIRKMMTGQGTGKGLDIKGKSAKKGKLSAYVPFLQIHEDEHKKKIRSLPRDGRIRIFYKKREARDNALRILREVLGDMTEKSNAALERVLKSDKVPSESVGQDDDVVGRILASFRTLSVKGTLKEEEQESLDIVYEWSMENPFIVVVDDYTPKCFGLDMPKRLFWEGYVTRAKDIGRPPGSVYDTGRPSRASFQDMNFASIKNDCEEDMPRAVVWQYTDPYLPPTEPDPDPMMPQTLLMAYEEHGRVMPVVSDFDCFLLGTRGVRFHTPLPDEQVGLVHSMLGDIDKILGLCKEGKTKNWTASWLDVMKHQKKHVHMPKYGFGDPKSYAIMKYAVQRLEEFGAVRHGAECFNFYFPQELDDEFLVIGGNLEGAKYKYMKLNELQDFLSGCIDLGFTFPLNPKWVLCDEGWKALWDKLTGSTHPNVQLSINAWYPPGSGLKERIEEISSKHPEGFQSDLSGRKKGTQAWDEAEIALDRYQRIQRAKRKLLVVLCWISIVQQSRKKVKARKDGIVVEDEEDSVVELALTNGKDEGKLNSGGGGRLSNGSEVGSAAEKRVSFQEPPNSRLSMVSNATADSEYSIPTTPNSDIFAHLGEKNNTGLVRAVTDTGLSRRGHSRSEIPSRMSSESDAGDDTIELIDSLLISELPLSEYQLGGLQRLREQFVAKSQPRINNRFERRHTSIDSRITAMLLEDVPSFILKEYGGMNGGYKGAATTFQAQVKKIMTAQRLMSAVKTRAQGNEHFLPVEWTVMSKESKQILAEKLSFQALSRWDYNIIELAELCNGSPLLFVGWAILGSPNAQQAMANDLGEETAAPKSCAEASASGYGFAAEFSVQIPILCTFLRTMEADYVKTNPYHNNTHAADVLQTLNTMLQLGGKEYASSPLDIFSILVAAVIHDVKHPGLNNNFQVNSCSELAVQYNDVSVLENYSITWFFSKLLGQTRDFTVDILSGLSKEQFIKARSIIVRSVLETDMTHHFALLKRMGIHHDMLKGKGPEEWLQPYSNEGVNYDPSMDMLCFLLHQADISNAAKPYPLFEEWANRILEESYAQGEKEASLSLPVSPLCDPLTTDKKQSQIGFIKFVVQPSYQLLGEILPLFAETVFPHIDQSLKYWDNYGKDEMEE